MNYLIQHALKVAISVAVIRGAHNLPRAIHAGKSFYRRKMRERAMRNTPPADFCDYDMETGEIKE